MKRLSYFLGVVSVAALPRLLGAQAPTHIQVAPANSVTQGVEWSSASVNHTGRQRNPIFRVPTKLRPRVEFWIDIFTRYGKDDSVIHHRDFPQAVFKVVRFGDVSKSMSERAYKNYRTKEIAKHVAEIKEAIKNLAAGKPPQNALETTIEQEMRTLGRGNAKYQKILKEDLIRSQTGIKERFREAVQRSGRYLHIIEKIFVEEFQLPVELTRLPYVESSFDYKAYSSVGAAGIWQFMPRTAQSYMQVNRLVDERRDVVSATRGAAKYLTYAYKQLDSWPLALTSYNHGIAGVARKVKSAGIRDITAIVEHPTERIFGFASTNFYPEFLAALEVDDHYEKYFPGVKKEEPVNIAQRVLPNSVSTDYVTRSLGIELSELQAVNYGISSRVWNGSNNIPQGYALKVPIRYASALAQLRLPEPRTGKTAPASSSVYGGLVYKVRRGDTLSRIAKKYNVTVSDLRELNDLRSDVVRVGQMLTVKPRENQKQESVVTPAKVPPPTASSAGVYVVQSGDTLSTIAKQHGTSVSRLRELNHLSSNRINIGQRLTLSGGPVSSSVVATESRVYEVRPGDNMWSISRKYNIRVTELQRANGLSSNRLKVGQKLKIP